MDTKSVLLVDDDEDLNEIHRMVLERAGFRVYTASDSTQAMSIATANTIDVAVLDVMMNTPTEGFVLARTLRQNEKTKGIPLLMLTSVNAYNEKRGSFIHFSNQERDDKWLPVDLFLEKPVNPDDLVTIVRTLARTWTFSRAS